MVPAIAQNVSEIVKAKTKAPVAGKGIIHNTHQEICNLFILKTVLGIVPVAVLTDGYDLTVLGKSYLILLY